MLARRVPPSDGLIGSNANGGRDGKQHHVSYSFLFMKTDGDQLNAIPSLIDSGIVRPVLDRVFSFESTEEAMTYVENGRAKGKVIVKVR